MQGQPEQMRETALGDSFKKLCSVGSRHLPDLWQAQRK
ncbi:hypothetical protein MMUC44124_15635 [Mycolicibacterium mucogenicum DSM 44124]|nr:hypothetical protein MMUC44124_15635 [Mycolicibacterium mucogenicum DSM 44124]